MLGYPIEFRAGDAVHLMPFDAVTTGVTSAPPDTVIINGDGWRFVVCHGVGPPSGKNIRRRREQSERRYTINDSTNGAGVEQRAKAIREADLEDVLC